MLPIGRRRARTQETPMRVRVDLATTPGPTIPAAPGAVMRSNAAALVWALGTASAAVAQSGPQTQGSISYLISWQEFGQGPGPAWSAPVAGGNGNGVIDPGEGALLKVTVAMSLTPG